MPPPKNLSDPLRPPIKGDSPRLVAWLAIARHHKSPTPGGAQELLIEFARKAQLEVRDQALAYEIMQGVWRNRLLLDHIIAHVPGFQDKTAAPDLRDIIHVGAQQHLFLDRIPPHALVHQTVEVARIRLGASQAGFTNALLKALIRQYPNPAEEMPALLATLDPQKRHSFPGWITRAIKRATRPDPIDATLKALNQPLPLYARVNPLLATPKEAIQALWGEDITLNSRPDLAPLALEINASATRLTLSPPFRQGLVTIQDPSAQLVAHLVDARPGQTVIDLCAAPGGKTTLLAAAMEKTGRLLACDANPKRLERLRENLTRLKAQDFAQIRLIDSDPDDKPGQEKIPAAPEKPLPADSPWKTPSASPDRRHRRRAQLARETTTPATPIAPLLEETDLQAQAHRVLVDAPCSGLGTLRRHPEIRWRLQKSDLPRLAHLQGRILDRAARLVRPGGILIYATCSLAPEENQDVVHRFLQRQQGRYEILTPEAEAPPEDILKNYLQPDGWLTLQPHLHPTDSARAVRLRRLPDTK